MRDETKSIQALDEVIDFKTESIDEFAETLKDQPNADFQPRMRWAFHLNMEHQERICAMYTRGNAISKIEPYYLAFLDNFSDLIDIASDDIDYVRDQYAYSLDKYYRIAVWAILFNVDIEDRKDFVERLEFFGAQKPCDVMFKRTRLLDRDINDRLGGEHVYCPLLEALENLNPEQQVVLLTKFLKGWYSGLKKMNVAWIDNHKSEHDIYFGYWCFEAAAAVKVLGLDPDRFKQPALFSARHDLLMLRAEHLGFNICPENP